MKAAREAEAKAFEEAEAAMVAEAAAARPLAEVRGNQLAGRLPTPALSQASSRPLSGHAEHVMATEYCGAAPVARPWSKKGKRGAPDGSRGARSEISEALSWAS